MKTTVSRWLPAISRNRTHIALLGLAATAAIGGIAAAPAPEAALASSETQTVATTDRTGATITGDKSGGAKAPAAKKAAPAKQTAPATKKLKHDLRLQPNGYFCGPAATRIALSAHGKAPSVYTLADKLGTTVNGTNSSRDITRVLNAQIGEKRYQTTEIANRKATAKQVGKLQADVVASINSGDPVVANIAGTVTDKAGEGHSYEGGHYLTVVGYSDKGRTVTIADPADRVGGATYQLSTTDLANWTATRGYSS